MCNLPVHWSHTTGKVITSLCTFPSCKLSEDVILGIKLCPIYLNHSDVEFETYKLHFN